MMKMSMVFGTVATALVIRETDSESEARPCCVFSLCWWRSGVETACVKGAIATGSCAGQGAGWMLLASQSMPLFYPYWRTAAGDWLVSS